MNTLDIQMRLLDVIEEREALAIELETKNSIEGTIKYRTLDKKMNDLIKSLASGQAKNTDTQFSLVECLIGIQEDIKDIKKSVATLEGQSKKQTVRYGNLIFSSSEANGKDLAMAVNPYADKKEVAPEVPVQKQLEESDLKSQTFYMLNTAKFLIEKALPNIVTLNDLFPNKPTKNAVSKSNGNV